MPTPSEIGAVAELEVAAALHRAGMTVYLPVFAPQARVDLIAAGPSGLLRIQCKTSRLRDSVVTFRTCSNTANRPADYRGQIDHFGVWSPELRRAFLVPVEVSGTRMCSLRLAPTRNHQRSGIRLAADYEIGAGGPGPRG